MTAIYHITHIDNLASILREGGLVCDRQAQTRGLCAQTIAYDAIKQRRASRRLERLFGGVVAAGGTLADYVPFYFTNRSPMLYAIHQGQVPDYQGGQSRVIYIVSSAEAVAGTNGVWCFTDGHAVEGITEFFDQLDDLAKVDWDAVGTWRWGGRWLLKDPDIKRRKQSEFLVYERFPWDLVEQVGVFSQTIAAQVVDILGEGGQSTRVTTQRDWYYNL